jgi:uncharacterized circularly permuted ATP-grasp superfamily protein
VNSSRGGGSKDTWVLARPTEPIEEPDDHLEPLGSAQAMAPVPTSLEGV